MDQAAQPHAVEMAAAVQTAQVVATVEAVLAVPAVQAHLHEHGGLTAENANLKAELAEVKAENATLQARIDELEELQHAPWQQALLAYARKRGEPMPKARTQRASLCTASPLGPLAACKVEPVGAAAWCLCLLLLP
jgi:cell division protein FtsB